jgi:hypothetical protein
MNRRPSRIREGLFFMAILLDTGWISAGADDYYGLVKL